MMFAKFEDSKELFEMLCLISTGLDTVSKIQGKTKMKQSTVSNRLMILRESDILYNKRWVYHINWNKVIEIFKKVVEDETRNDTAVKYIKTKVKPRKISEYFTDDLIKNIIVSYGYLILDGYERMNLKQLINNFLDWVSIASEETLKNVDKKWHKNIIELKELLQYRVTTNEFLFSVLTNEKLREKLKK